MPNLNSYIDSRQNVADHLENLRKALLSKSCQLDILPVKKGQSETDPFSTAYTLLKLEYNSSDIKRELAGLKVTDYIESIKDSVKIGSPDFRVFGIIRQGKEIYVKEKLRTENNIFCISFHFSEYPLKNRPYWNNY